MLRCQSWGFGINWHFRVVDMQTVRGNYFAFNFPANDRSNKGEKK